MGSKCRHEGQRYALFSLLGFSWNTTLHNHNTYAEDLDQSHPGSLIVASVSVSPHGPD